MSRLRQDVVALGVSLGASVDAVDAKNARAAHEFREGVKALSAHIMAVESKLAEATVQIARLETRLSTAEREAPETAAKLDAVGNAVAKLEAPPPSAAPPPTVIEPAPQPADRITAAPPKPSARPEDVFDRALGNFRAREHGQAVLEFMDFLERYPAHPLAGTARYWIGEAYFLQRDYRQAVTEFEKVREHGGSHARVPDAMVREAEAYRHMRDTSRATEVLQRVVRDYPKSPAAARARALLRTADRATAR